MYDNCSTCMYYQITNPITNLPWNFLTQYELFFMQSHHSADIKKVMLETLSTIID